MDYEQKYKEANDKVATRFGTNVAKEIFSDLYESEDEKIRKELIEFVKGWKEKAKGFCPKVPLWTSDEEDCNRYIAWLEKQGNEPNWCHHKVDLSNCSEEYRKAYYDGWNNCNQQYSQCKSEGNDVVKCLINGMKFYYEDNEEATWGTEKFSMKVKDILAWLEKQGTSYTKRDVDDAFIDKAATWFANRYQVNGYIDADDIEDFKNYMKGE